MARVLDRAGETDKRHAGIEPAVFAEAGLRVAVRLAADPRRLRERREARGCDIRARLSPGGDPRAGAGRGTA